MLVRLSRKEMALARQSSALRWQLARASGVANQKRAAESDNDLDYLGIRAEMATAKLIGADYSAAAMGIDDGVDMWHGDTSIDVKATFHQSGRLLFKSLSAFSADVAILVTKTGDEDVMNVVGGIGRAAFQSNAEKVDLGRGPCFVMSQDSLLEMPELWRRLCQRRFQ